MGKPEEHNNDTEILPLSMSSGTFEEIQSAWSFPSELLRTLLSITPLATEFETETDVGMRQFAYTRRNIGHDLRRFANPCSVPGLMLRSARSRDYSFSLALIYDRGTGSVSGLLHGLQEQQVRVLLSSLHKSVDVFEDPLLLPLILFEMRINFFALLLEKHAAALEVLEESTGMRHFNAQSKDTEEQKTERMQNLSFSDITQKLTGIAGTLAFCEWTFESCLKGLSVSRTWRNKIIDHSTNSETGCRWNASPTIERRVAYIKSLAVGAGAHGRLLEARRGAQVQTVSCAMFESVDDQGIIIRNTHMKYVLDLQPDRTAGQPPQSKHGHGLAAHRCPCTTGQHRHAHHCLGYVDLPAGHLHRHAVQLDLLRLSSRRR